MDDFRILLTGDYWHRDFATVIRNLSLSLTLQPLDGVASNPAKNLDYRLVIIAQSRCGQFEAGQLELILDRFADVPIVSLEGSWCEGESRSGSPIPGLIHIYWHQWQGHLDNFLYCLNRHQQSAWQLPRICTIADRILHESDFEPIRIETAAPVGISASTADGFCMLCDALDRSDQRSIWIEKWNELDGSSIRPALILVEGNSLSFELEQRIHNLQIQFQQAPIILVLNFPRNHEFERARKLGVAAIVSKPFALGNLYAAMQRAILNDTAA